MENRNIRGWIVRILQRAYPLGMEARSLQKQLNALGYPAVKRDMQANLAYLQEDNFIEKIPFGGEFVNGIYKLTTRGVDLAEGSIADEGVEI